MHHAVDNFEAQAKVRKGHLVARPIGSWIIVSASLVLLVAFSMPSTAAQRFWAWALTGLQVLAMWIAGSGRRAGWILGAGVQPGWIAYALLTDQEGFILGCVVSAGVQLSNVIRMPSAVGASSEQAKA